MHGRMSASIEKARILEDSYTSKQLELNKCIDEVAKLKQELAEKEKIVTKLKSYYNSSYILGRIFNITPDDKDSEKNKKGIGSEYHKVPPPLKEKYAFYDEEKVIKGLNMVDQLHVNIDVTYTKSDDASDLEVVSKVVESVLSENVSTNKVKSESQDTDEESFHKNYLKNSKSKKSANDDPTGLAYTMIGLDTLFSDIKFPIQNVIQDKIDKVFKPVEMENQKFQNLPVRARKIFITNRATRRRTRRLGCFIKRKKIKIKSLKSKIFKRK
ncbi:hypothetical protein Hanom_Chr06g00539481 [Helianthus anomalus]